MLKQKDQHILLEQKKQCQVRDQKGINLRTDFQNCKIINLCSFEQLFVLICHDCYMKLTVTSYSTLMGQVGDAGGRQAQGLWDPLPFKGGPDGGWGDHVMNSGGEKACVLS